MGQFQLSGPPLTAPPREISQPVGRILVIHVHFEDEKIAHGIGMLIPSITWSDKPLQVLYHRNPNAGRTAPSETHMRLLPSMLGLVEQCPKLSLVVMSRPGVGQRLYDATNGQVPVVSVGRGTRKPAFMKEQEARDAGIQGEEQGEPAASHNEDIEYAPLFRGGSLHPLNISAVGMPLPDAVDLIKSMSGPARVPAVLLAAEEEAMLRGGKVKRDYRGYGQNRGTFNSPGYSHGTQPRDSPAADASREWRRPPPRQEPRTRTGDADRALDWRRR